MMIKRMLYFRSTMAVFGVLMFLLFAGCGKDPFSTRTSEPPRSIGGTYLDPVTAEIAVDNLFHACNEQSIVNYTLTLDNQFEFTFDFLNTGQPGGTTNWSNAEDVRIIDNIFRNLDTLVLDWRMSQADLDGDTSAVYYRAYTILTVTAAVPPETTLYTGETVLFLRENEAARWLVYRWEDRHLEGSDYSWADLKARYR